VGSFGSPDNEVIFHCFEVLDARKGKEISDERT
jgi:hypothetical protein